MCSINGVYGSLDSSDISWARKAQDMLKYRGPDESDSSLDERCSLNSNRFSITGVDNGTMPISNEDGTIQVILNGEVYNHKELRKELEGEGHRFTKDSDTETIVHLYEKYGENCFEHIEGMYAVAIYDSKNDRLVVGRDPFGQKPLFYVEKEGKIYFASEHRALLDLTSREVSNDALAQYFSLGFSINPLVEGIKRLQAGTYVVADSN